MTENNSKANLGIGKQKETSEVEPEEKLFQCYKSARESMRLITDKGVKITFAAYSFITDNQNVIDYLNEQILIKGLPGITKGELISTEEANPMEALRKQHIADYLAQEEANAGKEKDFGKSGEGIKLKPVTSKQVAS